MTSLKNNAKKKKKKKKVDQPKSIVEEKSD